MLDTQLYTRQSALVFHSSPFIKTKKEKLRITTLDYILHINKYKGGGGKAEKAKCLLTQLKKNTRWP